MKPICRLKKGPVLAPLIAGLPVLRSKPVTLIGFGASSGAANFWKTFVPSLRARDIDMLLAQFARQNDSSVDSVTYHAAISGLLKSAFQERFDRQLRRKSNDGFV